MTGVFWVSAVDIWAEQFCYGTVVNYKIRIRLPGLYPPGVAMILFPDLVTYAVGSSYAKTSVLVTTMGLSTCKHAYKISHAWRLTGSKACRSHR